jgi:hypothetical protein
MSRFAVLLLLPVLLGSAQDQEEMGEAAKLKILYAGKPCDVREERFLKLLRSHFLKVDAISLWELSPAKAGGYDVVVADWGRRYKRGGFSSEEGHRFQLSPDFVKPVVMIGAVGGEIQHHTKLDWL